MHASKTAPTEDDIAPQCIALWMAAHAVTHADPQCDPKLLMLTFSSDRCDWRTGDARFAPIPPVYTTLLDPLATLRTGSAPSCASGGVGPLTSRTQASQRHKHIMTGRLLLPHGTGLPPGSPAGSAWARIALPAPRGASRYQDQSRPRPSAHLREGMHDRLGPSRKRLGASRSPRASTTHRLRRHRQRPTHTPSPSPRIVSRILAVYPWTQTSSRGLPTSPSSLRCPVSTHGDGALVHPRCISDLYAQEESANGRCAGCAA